MSRLITTSDTALPGVTETVGPYQGERVYQNSRNYSALFSTEGFVFFGETLIRDTTEQSRLARIPKVNRSVVGQSADRDVQLGNVSLAQMGNPGHYGIAVAANGTHLHANRAQHGSGLTFEPLITAGLDPASLAGDGTLTSRADYIKFFRNPDNEDIWLIYRGGSTLDMGRLYRHTSGAWVEVHVPFVSHPENNWFYTSGSCMAFDSAGRVVIAWTQRDRNADPHVNIGAHLAISADNGATWTKMDGTAIPLPITIDNTDRPLTYSSGLFPDSLVTFDSADRPMVNASYIAEGDTNSGLWIAQWDGTQWDRYKLHDWGYATPLAPHCIPFAAGNALGLIYADGNAIRCWLSGDRGLTWDRRTVADTTANPVDEIHFDQTAWAHDRRLRIATSRRSVGTESSSSFFEIPIPTDLPKRAAGRYVFRSGLPVAASSSAVRDGTLVPIT